MSSMGCMFVCVWEIHSLKLSIFQTQQIVFTQEEKEEKEIKLKEKEKKRNLALASYESRKKNLKNWLTN